MRKPNAKKLFNHSKIARRIARFRLNEFLTKPVGLCDYCKKQGYCRLSIDLPIVPSKNFTIYTINDYLDLIPIQIKGSELGNYSKLHLQIACDAFHQQDYETAILHFRAVLEVRNFYEANIGLAVAYFMIKDYENAIRFAEYCSDREVSIITSLKEDIIKLSTEEAALNEQVITEVTTVEDDSNLQLLLVQKESVADGRLVSVVG